MVKTLSKAVFDGLQVVNLTEEEEKWKENHSFKLPSTKLPLI